MNNPETGDLVYIIDPKGEEPTMMGVGLIVGETKVHESAPGLGWQPTTPVLWDGRVAYLDESHWMFEVIKKAI
tara:strand:+ start:360 stop:578 length:219 start_codon:yes stop_codon:yes gene_type:complete